MKLGSIDITNFASASSQIRPLYLGDKLIWPPPAPLPPPEGTEYLTNILNRFTSLSTTGNFIQTLEEPFVDGVVTNVTSSLVTTKNGFNNTVNSIAIDSNGKIYVGGNFTSYNGTTANRIIRLNPDGTIDTGFTYGTGFDNNVLCIAINSSNKVYVGGQFTTYNGTSSNRIIRLNTDGSIDSAFNIGSGFNNNVTAIAVDSSDKIYVGGIFTQYNLANRTRIVKLNADGSRDTGFDSSSVSAQVNAIVIDSNGKIYLGGVFTSYIGTGANRIVRANTDATIDTGFVYGTGFSAGVNSIAIDSNGKIYVGGGYTTYNGTAASRIVRLNGDGTIDTGFVYGTGFNTGTVNTIAIDSNGKIYMGGGFTSYNGTEANRIISLNSDGTVNTGFVYGTGLNNTTNFIKIGSSDKIYTGGLFTSYNGI